MKILYVFLIGLLTAFSSLNMVIAAPVIDDRTKATLAFTLLDGKSKLSYVVDLEINLIELIDKRQAFEIDILSLLEKQGSLPEGEVKDFRWGVVGAVDDAMLLKEDEFKLFNGYVAAYDGSKLPYSHNLNDLRQKTKRLKYYFKDGLYSAEPNEVSVRNSGMKSGYYLSGWEGNFNGLDEADLEAEGAHSMTLWSLMAVDLDKLRRDKLGTISLSESGRLKFTPFEK